MLTVRVLSRMSTTTLCVSLVMRRDVNVGRWRYARRYEYFVSGEKGIEDAEEGQFVLVLRKTDLCGVSANNQRNVRWKNSTSSNASRLLRESKTPLQSD